MKFRMNPQGAETVRLAVTDSVKVTKGDAVYVDSGDDYCKPASSFTWTTDEDTTQANFAAEFVGIALEDSQHPIDSNKHKTHILVDISGSAVWKATLNASGATAVDDAFALKANTGGTALQNQVWENLGNSADAQAIARAAVVSSSQSTARIRIASSLKAHNTNAVVG